MPQQPKSSTCELRRNDKALLPNRLPRYLEQGFSFCPLSPVLTRCESNTRCGCSPADPHHPRCGFDYRIPSNLGWGRAPQHAAGRGGGRGARLVVRRIRWSRAGRGGHPHPIGIYRLWRDHWTRHKRSRVAALVWLDCVQVRAQLAQINVVARVRALTRSGINRAPRRYQEHRH
jgi:hypothetical protein